MFSGAAVSNSFKYDFERNMLVEARLSQFSGSAVVVVKMVNRKVVFKG